MSLDREQPKAHPVLSIEDLIAFFRNAERPPSKHQLGLEHEKFIYPESELCSQGFSRTATSHFANRPSSR
jgi:hypothetical protein